MLFEPLGGFVARHGGRLQDHEGLRLDHAFFIWPCHHGGFKHVRMGQQRALDLERRNAGNANVSPIVPTCLS
jgi:hypothetical protein